MSADREILGRLVRLAGPVAFARLGIMGMGVADTVVVGQLAPDELPALALGLAPMGAFLVGGIGLLTGVQVLAARAVGEGRPQHAGAVFRRGVILSWIAGLASAALLFLIADDILLAFGIEPELARAAGEVSVVLALQIPLHLTYVAGAYFMEALSRPAPGAAVMWVGNGVNLALNLVLVPEYGAIGSAWATVGARVFLAVAMTGWIVLSPALRVHAVAGRPAPGAPGFDALLKVGAAAGVSQVAEAGAFSVMTIVCGRISANAVATYQISLNILAVIFMVALGFAAATQVLVSEYIGANRRGTAFRAAWLGSAANGASMIAFGVLVVAFGQVIGRAFTSDPGVILALTAVMPVLALTLLPDGGQVVAAAALRGQGDNWFPTASHIFSYVLVMPPIAYVLGERLGRGVSGVLEAVLIASVISAAILLVRLVILTRRESSPLRG